MSYFDQAPLPPSSPTGSAPASESGAAGETVKSKPFQCYFCQLSGITRTFTVIGCLTRHNQTAHNVVQARCDYYACDQDMGDGTTCNGWIKKVKASQEKKTDGRKHREESHKHAGPKHKERWGRQPLNNWELSHAFPMERYAKLAELWWNEYGDLVRTEGDFLKSLANERNLLAFESANNIRKAVYGSAYPLHPEQTQGPQAAFEEDDQGQGSGDVNFEMTDEMLLQPEQQDTTLRQPPPFGGQMDVSWSEQAAQAPVLQNAAFTSPGYGVQMGGHFIDPQLSQAAVTYDDAWVGQAGPQQYAPQTQHLPDYSLLDRTLRSEHTSRLTGFIRNLSTQAAYD